MNKLQAFITLVATAGVLLCLAAALSGCGSTSANQNVTGAPGFAGYHVNEDGEVTWHALNPAGVTSATANADGIDTLGSLPLANMGFRLPNGVFVTIQSPRDVTGKGWTVKLPSPDGEISIELAEIGLSSSEPIRASAEFAATLSDAIIAAVEATVDLSEQQKAALTESVGQIVKGLVEGVSPVE